jgi:hypothetical protein
MLVGLRLVEGRRLRGCGRLREGQIARVLGRRGVGRHGVGGSSKGRLIWRGRRRVGRQALALCGVDAAAQCGRHCGGRGLVGLRGEGARRLLVAEVLRLHRRRRLVLLRIVRILLVVVVLSHGGGGGGCSSQAGAGSSGERLMVEHQRQARCTEMQRCRCRRVGARWEGRGLVGERRVSGNVSSPVPSNSLDHQASNGRRARTARASWHRRANKAEARRRQPWPHVFSCSHLVALVACRSPPDASTTRLSAPGDGRAHRRLL